MLPLNGMTVIDFSNWFPGPYCARLLSDMGARVIKIERPVFGDPERNMAGTFNVINAGKESLAVDMSTEAGREIIYRLISKSDILLESFRPGTVARLGIDYEIVSSMKKDIIYCSLSGFGQSGPLASKPAHNISAMAESGVLDLGGRTEGKPSDSSGIWVGDLSAAMFAVITILGAVLQRGRTGEGAHIDISMSDCCISWISGIWGEFFNGSKSKEEIRGFPAYGVFQTKEGKYMTIAAVGDQHWLTLCESLELNELLDDPLLTTLKGRKKLIDQINTRIGEKIITREREYWLELLTKLGIAANPVTTLDEIPTHSHFLQRGLIDLDNPISPAAGVAFPAVINNQRWGKGRSAAPQLGQNTQAVLESIGCSKEEIDDLVLKGIVYKKS